MHPTFVNPVLRYPQAVPSAMHSAASHICKSCASLPAEKQAELMTLNRLLNLPWRLSKEQLSWLKNRLKDRRPDVRALAQEQYEMRFPPRHLEDDEFNFFDEESFIE